MQRQKKQASPGLKPAIIFSIIVSFALLISLTIKFVSVYNNSLYDARHRFTVAFVQEGTDGTSVLLSLSPQQASLVAIPFQNNPRQKETMAEQFGVPIEGTVQLPQGSVSSVEESTQVYQLVKDQLLFRPNATTNLTLYDKLRFAIAAYMTNREDIVVQDLGKAPSDIRSQAVFATLLTDATIHEEKRTIHIVNAANTPGLGNTLAEYITNMGGNVVSVTTSANEARASEITAQEDSLTARRLAKVLHMPFVVKKDSSIADITITIGNDRKETLF